MKYIVLIPDGMADWPIKRLGNRTCLQAANTPNMDRIASGGEVGMVRTIPSGFNPGSDVAILSIFGYNPAEYYTGRAPLEAVARGIKLKSEDIAYRCNLVTLRFPSSNKRDMAKMEDYSAGHISTAEAKTLIKHINRRLGDKEIIFYPGISYRHLMIWRGGVIDIKTTPPHDITGKRIAPYLPSGDHVETLNTLMEKSTEVLMSHPVNKKRMSLGLRPANSIWLWGQGRRPEIPKFKSKYGLRGALISAVDLVKGLGIYAGLEIIKVSGATGYLDTNYLGKAKAALKALRRVEFVCVHVEAPDEASHKGNIREKIRAIEEFDSKVIGTILNGLKRFKDYKILLLPDHSTPIKIKTHIHEPVPFAIYKSNNIKGSVSVRHFSEDICSMKGIQVFNEGYRLMDYFLKGC
jgi:2,3-bisphosphoglycerate-independent phosphoglycerate mutase